MTQTDIANIALGHIGQPVITNILDTKGPAVQVRRYFNLALEQALSAYDWQFCRYEQTLTKLVGSTNTFESVFQLPVNPKFLKLLKDEEMTAYLVGGNVIYSNEDELTIWYTGLNERAGEYSPWFVEYFTWKLASLMSTPVTMKPQVIDRVRAMENQIYMQAIFRESEQLYVEIDEPEEWENA